MASPERTYGGTIGLLPPQQSTASILAPGKASGNRDFRRRADMSEAHPYTFMEASRDIATCMYYTGIDPFTKQKVYVAKGLRDRKMQRTQVQFFKSEKCFTARAALLEAVRKDLIRSGGDCLKREGATPLP